TLGTTHQNSTRMILYLYFKNHFAMIVKVGMTRVTTHQNPTRMILYLYFKNHFAMIVKVGKNL
ncbi:hypothetical protein DPMN_092656, partial [Dreissena polymorpha]